LQVVQADIKIAFNAYKQVIIKNECKLVLENEKQMPFSVKTIRTEV